MRAPEPPAQSGQPLPPLSDEDTLESDLSAAVEHDLPDLPDEQRTRVVRAVAVVAREQFAGPLPHPRYLRDYDAVLPGAADRIIAMAEKEQAHRIEIERRAQNSEYHDRRAGMYIGAAAFSLLVLIAAVLAWEGNNWGSGLFLGAGSLGVIALFVNGRQSS